MTPLVAALLAACSGSPSHPTPTSTGPSCPAAPARLDPATPVAGRPVRCVAPEGLDGAEVTWTAPRLDEVGLTWSDPVLPGAFVGVGDPIACAQIAPDCRADAPAVPAAADPRPPSILLILADDLGAYELAPFGATDPLPAPRLERLAAEGVTFTRAWANPLCGPTRAAILTGRHGLHTGHGTNIRVADASSFFPTQETTLAEWGAGAPAPFRAAAVGKWHLATWAEGGGARVLEHGFSTYRGALGNLYADQTSDGGPASYTAWEKSVDAEVSRVTGYVTVDEVDDAIALAATLPQPWFLYLALHATHEPHTPPPPELLPEGHTRVANGRRGDFADMLAVMDDQLGRLLDAIPPDAHVVFMADNGDDEDVRPADRGERQVKGSAFEGGVRVPLIIRSPSVRTPGASVRALVDAADLFPTLAAWMQRPDTASLALDGRSLIPFLLRPDHADDATAYAERRQPNGLTAPEAGWERWDRAIRDDRYKLLRRRGAPDQLFDVGDRLVDGQDLMVSPLHAEAAAAHARLAARLDADDVGE